MKTRYSRPTVGGRAAIGAILACAAMGAASTAGAATFKEYSVGAFPGQQPRYIKAGPDGNLWYADGGTEGGIGRISPQGELFARFGGLGPVEIAFAPDGTAYWAGDFGTGRRTAGGSILELNEWKGGYAAAVAPSGELWYTAAEGIWCETFFTEGKGCRAITGIGGRITGLVFDRNGNAWGAYSEENLVHELTGPELRVDLPAGSRPARIALGPEGDLWVTMFEASAVDRITPAGQRTRFPLSPGAGANDIALGPDGAFWITEYEADKIARMTTSGELTGEFPVPTPGAHPAGIAAGPDGAMWFTEINTAKVGRISIDSTTTTPAPGAGGPGTAGARDTTPPSFTRAPSLHPSRFRDSGPGSGRIPKGSVLAFTLSEASWVKARAAAARPGRKAHGSCVGLSKSNRGKPHCRRFVELGSPLSYKALRGANRFAFSGRVAGRSLRPGEYRLTLVATDAAGNGSAPAKVTFTIAP